MAISHELDEKLVRIGHDLGEALATEFPADIDPAGHSVVPKRGLTSITDGILIVLAEAIQSWINAGSERDATVQDEELIMALMKHLGEWTDTTV